MSGSRKLRDLLENLTPEEAPIAIAIAELLGKVDGEGRVDRAVWSASVRAVFRSLRREERAPNLHVPVGDQDAFRHFLSDEVVARLEAEGIARRDGRSGDWEVVAIDSEIWAAVTDSRQELRLQAEERAHALLQARQARRIALPETDGSRLRAEGLTKIYRKRKVVDDVDLDVRQGEIVGLLGPNGAGKTTTFYMVVGLIPPNAGRVFLDDQELTGVPMYRRARMGVGYLAQEPSVFRKLTVEENVLAILETLKLSKAERMQRLEELLNELSIAHLRNVKAFALSGGERRRVEITRALVQRPKFMLLDEPFAGIDPIAVNDIQQIVRGLKDRRIGAIISDHNVEQTLEIVDRAYIIYEGRIRVSGTVPDLVWNDEVAEIYFGPTLTARMRERYSQPGIPA